jgi:hypothetical protein
MLLAYFVRRKNDLSRQIHIPQEDKITTRCNCQIEKMQKGNKRTNWFLQNEVYGTFYFDVHLNSKDKIHRVNEMFFYFSSVA